jgi:hypothetical protein
MNFLLAALFGAWAVSSWFDGDQTTSIWSLVFGILSLWAVR